MRVGLLAISLALCCGIALFGLNVSAQDKKAASNLIHVPVTVTDANGQFITDLQQTDFQIFENGVKQNVVSFAGAGQPFTVVLLLDTSISTQEKLGDIRKAAQVFVDQLQKTDRIKVITFDDQVRELTDFTADRAVLKKAIFNAQPGYGTKFYDGMNVALEALRQTTGRKAIVIFSDGVDYRSDYASAESTLRSVEQDDVLVYPIRFSTRVAAELLAREQAGQGPQLPTREVVRSTSGSQEPAPGELPRSEPSTGPLGLPLPAEILRRRRESERGRDRLPPTDRPPAGEIGQDIPTGRTDPRVSSKSRERKQPTEDPIKVMLDRLYNTADTYLQTAAEKSGGQLLQADDVTALPAAFSQIAIQLRAQYFLGYEPAKKTREDKYQTILVTSTRPSGTIRARAGYRPTQ